MHCLMRTFNMSEHILQAPIYRYYLKELDTWDMFGDNSADAVSQDFPFFINF